MICLVCAADQACMGTVWEGWRSSTGSEVSWLCRTAVQHQAHLPPLHSLVVFCKPTGIQVKHRGHCLMQSLNVRGRM